MFPKEILKLILYHCDSDTIMTCCRIKLLGNVCDDHFWLDKFKYDNVPLLIMGQLPSTLSKWMTLYKKLVKVHKNVQWLLCKQNWSIRIHYSINQSIIQRFREVLPKIPSHFPLLSMTLEINMKSCSYKIDNIVKFYKRKSKFVYLLHQLLYYIPEIKLTKKNVLMY